MEEKNNYNKTVEELYKELDTNINGLTEEAKTVGVPEYK